MIKLRQPSPSPISESTLSSPYGIICLQAEKAIQTKSLDKEYLGITGLADYNRLAAELAYGEDSAPLKEGRLVSTQSLSGTGALRIGGVFLGRWYAGKGGKKIYLPTPRYVMGYILLFCSC
jgi:aspartate/tyrosine/aromatic aminotransferase